MTEIASDLGLITTEYISLHQGALFARQQFNSASTSLLLIYCYDSSGNYLGYKARQFNQIGDTSYEFPIYENTAKIRVYVNNKTIDAADICLSETSLDAFESYEIRHIIKESALPDLEIGKELYGKVIANFGDSIFGNKRPPNDVSTALANITGATVYNLGFGGCRMAQHTSADWDAFCMYRLAYAIANDDFTVQNAVDVDSVSGMPSYFKDTRTLLESIDFSEVDIITISYGTNDFTGWVELDNPNNLHDTATYCGALRYSLETILEAYPQLHVFVCTPTYRFWIDGNNDFIDDSDTHEINGHLLTDFVEAVQTVSNAYHLKSIDNYYELGINKFNRLHWFPTTDGTHHNKLGGELIAQHMANEMF